MKKFFYLFFIFTIIFSGCSSSDELKKEEKRRILNSWMGSHKSALIRSWGPPTRYASDGQGGEILIYEYSTNIGSVIYGTYFESTFVNYTEMYANKEGILYHWRYGSR